MMTPTTVAASTIAGTIWNALAQPITEWDWRFWQPDILRQYWLAGIFDDRYRVCYFLPLLPILMLLRGRALKIGIIVTCCVFLAYNFGLLYPLFWLALCAGFYKLTERWCYEIKRTDVLKIGPPLAAVGCVIGVALLTGILKITVLPAGLNTWLHTNIPWIFPLGTRPFAWEPHWVNLNAATPQLLDATFFDLHYIGVAYFMVRMLHYFSELKRDGIPRESRSLLNFVSYLCYAPTLMQGPVERYPQFLAEIETCHRRRRRANVPPACARAGIGMLKVLVSTLYLRPFLWTYGVGLTRPEVSYYDRPEEIASYAIVYLGVFAQILTLYLEFSGYCDMAAAMSRLLGYRLAENFKKPWLSTSMRDYWRRWHLTLSFILRDYVYIALGGNRRHVLFNLCFTFFLCGIWHRTVPKVAVWGVVMGVMVWISHRWAIWVKQLDARTDGFWPTVRRRFLKLHPLPRICAWLVTQHAFVWSILILFGGEGAIRITWELLRRPLICLGQWFGVDLDLPPVNAWFGTP